MQPAQVSIYDQCPIYQSMRFTYRLVRDEDAHDLLDTYSDEKSAELFNSDNCRDDFRYQDLDQMSDCIRMWLVDYRNRGYVRFSIVDHKIQKVIGTIEFFAYQELYKEHYRVGLLRLDLASDFEREEIIDEIIEMIDTHFYEAFEVNGVITKAVPRAQERIRTLLKRGFEPLPPEMIVPYADYYLKLP